VFPEPGPKLQVRYVSLESLSYPRPTLLLLPFDYRSTLTEILSADKNNDYCQNTGWGSTWCQPPPEYPPEACPGKQKWCADKNECECPAPMWWDDSSKECKYQPMPEPSCPPLQSPYCGKSKEEWCSYGELIGDFNRLSFADEF
jgi:hypothetical protein